MCCSPWVRKESDTTERLNSNKSSKINQRAVERRDPGWLGEGIHIGNCLCRLDLQTKENMVSDEISIAPS